MSNQMNDKIWEDALERFWDASVNNYDFYCLLQMYFFTSQEVWEIKEYGETDEWAFERAFNDLLKWNYELTLLDPIEAVKQYVNEKEKNK
jgi:hypothetical protein